MILDCMLCGTQHSYNCTRAIHIKGVRIYSFFTLKVHLMKKMLLVVIDHQRK